MTIIVYGVGCVFVTFFGFVAAYLEQKKLLLMNAGSLGVGLVVGVSLLIAVASADFEAIITDNCDDLLNLLHEDFYGECSLASARPLLRSHLASTKHRRRDAFPTLIWNEYLRR